MKKNQLFSPEVAIAYRENIKYPEKAPYDPPEIFPELELFNFHADEANNVYSIVRKSFYLLGLDKDNFGTKQWNPFSAFIKKGDKVIIKPNAVYHSNPADSIFAMITHPSILRIVIDYCLLALEEEGSITIADCPVMSSDFSKWKEIMHIPALLNLYRDKTNITIQCVDLRQTYVKWMLGHTPTSTRKQVSLDPLGYTMINLREESAFSTLSEKEIGKIYGADDTTQETIDFHSKGNHIYEVSNTFLDCDVLISVPKLKVHKKVGITTNIKGMVGMIGNKNSIPHFRRHSPKNGGDEYPDDLPALQKLLNRYRIFLITKILSKHTNLTDLLYMGLDMPRRIIEYIMIPKFRIHKAMLGGSWYGNDTAWRMGADIIKIALYGKIGSENIAAEPKRFFSVIDGIIGGENDGPLLPSAKQSGVVLSGFNPLSVDWVAARLINFDPSRIKMLVSAKGDSKIVWNGSELPIIKSDDDRLKGLWENQFCIPFIPPVGWRNHIELFPTAVVHIKTE